MVFENILIKKIMQNTGKSKTINTAIESGNPLESDILLDVKLEKMKLIIIPTDFSPVAENAMQYGIEMAKAVNASVLLLHVYQVPVTISDTPIVLVSVDELKKNAEDQLGSLKSSLQKNEAASLKIDTEVRMGNVTDELESICETIMPFAVVMGTRGSSAIEKVLFGSNTLTAIRHLLWPVICVPDGCRFGDGIRKIGLACDFAHEIENKPAHFIKELVKTFGASLQVLNIDYHNRHFTPDTPEESFLIHKTLEELKPTYHYIENKAVEEGIHDFAETNGLDLLIAIPQKHKLLEGLFKPSATKQLIFHSHIPVMCVHA